MNKFDIKDGEYTSTIYTLIKEQRFHEAIAILTFIYDSNPSSRAALSLLAYCHYYMQVYLHLHYMKVYLQSTYYKLHYIYTISTRPCRTMSRQLTATSSCPSSTQTR